MKLKLKWLAAAASVLLAAAPMSVLADEEETTEPSYFTSADGMYNYVIDDNGNAMITDLIDNQSYEGELVIPSEIDGVTVAAIGNGAFVGAVNLTSVTIPASVTEVGECAFMKCTSIETFIVEEGNTYLSVNEDGVLLGDGEEFLIAYPCGRTETSYTVPDGVEEIAPGAFSYAVNLTDVTVPEGVLWIDPWAFSYSSVTNITLPDSLETIDDYAFAYCTHLHDVHLGEGLVNILNAAFAECRALTEITLPDSLAYIGQQAFIGTSLPSVTIPANVNTISYYAFGYDTSFKQIESFVVYGEKGTVAESYCSSVDEENDYENSFTFVDISGEGETQAMTDAAGNVIPAETAQAATAPGTTQDEKKDPLSKDAILRYVLIGCGGVAVVLAGVLAVLLRKKPAEAKKSEKSTKQDDES